MEPKTRVGLLFGGSVLFLPLGLVITAKGDWRLGLGWMGLCGVCVAVFAYQLRLLSAEEGAPRLLTLQPGIPLVTSKAIPRAAAGLVALSGISSMLIGFERNQLMWWLGLVLVLGGAVLAVREALGLSNPRTLLFSPDGIYFLGGPVQCLLHFDNLAQVQEADWNGQRIILVLPIDLTRLLSTVAEDKRAAAANTFGDALATLGAPLMIRASMFGLQSQTLMRTIERYVREPSTREELRAVSSSP